VLTKQKQVNVAREQVAGIKGKLAMQEAAATQRQESLRASEAQRATLAEQRQDARAKLELGEATEEEVAAIVKETLEQHQQLFEVERRHKAEIAEANDIAAGLQRVIAKAEGDLKTLERELLQAAIDCIRREAEQEAADYLKDALALDTRYKRIVGLNAMLQTVGKKLDQNLDLGFARGQVADFSVPKFALEAFGKWGYGAPDHFVCSSARLNVDAAVEAERERFTALGAESVSEATRHRKAATVPFAKGA
jgi:hypothetical protein